MTTFAYRRLAPALFALSLAVPASAQPIQWWKSEPAKQELGLAADQAARIDSIFQASMIDLRRQKADLDKVEATLSHLIETNADEALVTRHIDSVETARAALNKTRTLMLLHMRQVLTPDQRTKLTTMRDRWNKDQRGRDDQRNQDRSRGGPPRPDTRKDGR